MSKCIPSTTGVYIPGTGITLTRANIELIQEARAKDGKEPLDAAGIVVAFLPPGIDHPTELKDYKRYLGRAYKLVGGKPTTSKKAAPKKDDKPVESAG